MEPIILASGSPRRQEYFKLLGLPVKIMPARLAESPGTGQSPEEYTRDMAIRKVNHILEQLHGMVPSWVCGADTVIAIDKEILGKPGNRAEAQTMLEKLRGRNHEVSTSMALYNGKTKTTDCRSVRVSVSFASLSDEEIEWYLNTGEWQGTAGAYKIQGLGGCFASAIKGSYSAIVGLPLHEFYVMLAENGYQYGARETPG